MFCALFFRYIDVCEIVLGWPLLFLLASTVRSSHNLGSWRCRLNLSRFLLTIYVGGFWSVQSVLEFNVIKENLRIMSDIERVSWYMVFKSAMGL